SARARIQPPPVKPQPPCHPHEPGLEPVSIPELCEAPVGLGKRVLGNILGILPVPEHAVGDAERQRRGLAKAMLELPFEILVQRHERPGIPARPLIHSGSSSKTVWKGKGFSLDFDPLNCPVCRHILHRMAIKDAMLPEFDHEMGTTRRLLERTPEAEFGWKPHEKSFSLGQLARHLAKIPHWGDAM